MKDKMIKGLQNPTNVPPYLGRKFLNKTDLNDEYLYLYRKYHRHIRSRNSCIYQSSYTRFSDVPTEGRKGIKETFFGDLEMNQHFYHNFLTYLKLCEFAYHSGCRSVLEIGAGYSTAIWAEYAERTGGDITSIDGDFEYLEDRVGGTQHESKINANVNLIEGASIEPDDVREFYSVPRTELGGVDVIRFADDLDRFARAEGASSYVIKKMARLASSRNWSVDDLIISDGNLSFPDEFVDTYVFWQNDLDDYISMLEGVQRTGVVDELAEESSGWDLIWFDSGEVSSIVEWHKFKQYINPGGLAAFHDIFFPKSMKNFVVGASLLRDSNWEVLLVDDTTEQGLLVARRKPE